MVAKKRGRCGAERTQRQAAGELKTGGRDRFLGESTGAEFERSCRKVTTEAEAPKGEAAEVVTREPGTKSRSKRKQQREQKRLAQVAEAVEAARAEASEAA